MAKELGFATAILIGVALGYVFNLILTFWVGLVWKNFTDSKWYWKLFWVNMVACTIATCVIPMDFLDKTIDAWGKPFLIIVFGSILIMVIYGNIKKK